MRDVTRSWHFSGPDDGRRLPRLLNFTHVVRRAPEAGNMRRNLHWGLDYHFRRAGEFSLDGKSWQDRVPATAHLYAPGTPYWERSSARELPFPETYIVFLAEKEPELEALVSGGGGFARFRDESGVLGAVFNRLLEGGSGGNRLWKAQGALFEIVDALVGGRAQGRGDYLLSAGGEAPPESLAARVDACIRARYDGPLTLEEMARAAGVSRSTLTHRYAREAGATPFARLNEYRLDVARGMLLKGERSKEIAAHTGFYDEYHFAKAFKRRFGLPPRQYARTSSRPAAG
jgi:AraC-like DNA-binding protein